MANYEVREGDGNDGTFPTYTVESDDLDAVVAAAMESFPADARDDVDEAGDDLFLSLALFEYEGMSALNGAAYQVVEIVKVS